MIESTHRTGECFFSILFGIFFMANVLEKPAVKDGLDGSYWGAVESVGAKDYAAQLTISSNKGKEVEHLTYAKNVISDWYDRYPRSSDSAHSSVADKVVELFRSRFYKLGRVSDEDSALLVERIRHVLREVRPLHIVMMGSAFKVQNPLKTGGSVSDIAELHAFLRMKRLLDDLDCLEGIDPRFHYIWEGNLHAKHVGVSKNDVDRCWERMSQYVSLIGDKRICLHDAFVLSEGKFDLPNRSEEILDFETVESVVSHPAWSSYVHTHCASFEDFEAKVLWFKRMATIRFSVKTLLDDELAMNVVRDFRLFLTTVSSYKQGGYVERAFPLQDIRLTARPRPGAIGFSTTGNRKALLPHHGVAVQRKEKWTVHHMVRVLNDDSLRSIVDESGAIIAFELK
jgi:hypothetical protein